MSTIATRIHLIVNKDQSLAVIDSAEDSQDLSIENEQFANGIEPGAVVSWKDRRFTVDRIVVRKLPREAGTVVMPTNRGFMHAPNPHHLGIDVYCTPIAP